MMKTPKPKGRSRPSKRRQSATKSKSPPKAGAKAKSGASGAVLIEEPHVNPAPRHREIWIRDPDGYVVVIASPDGEAG
jgi:hypothetical protein